MIAPKPMTRDQLLTEVVRVARWYAQNYHNHYVRANFDKDPDLEDFGQAVAVQFLKTGAEKRLSEFKLSTLACYSALSVMRLDPLGSKRPKFARRFRTAGDFRTNAGNETLIAEASECPVAVADELDYILADLPEREIEILVRRADGETLAEIGERDGVSRERIRQIETRAMRKVTSKATATAEYGPWVTKGSNPDGYAFVCDDGSIVHVTRDGAVHPTGWPTAWAAEFIAAGDWKRPHGFKVRAARAAETPEERNEC